MNELQIEAMERKLQEMQEQLKAMKEERAKDTFLPMLPDVGQYFLGADMFAVIETDRCTLSAKRDNDQNIFHSKDIAEAYGDAFRVMLELRRCEGAGHYDEDYQGTYAFALDEEGDIHLASSDDTTRFILFPHFQQKN